jgi:hypothetical protein
VPHGDGEDSLLLLRHLHSRVSLTVELMGRCFALNMSFISIAIGENYAGPKNAFFRDIFTALTMKDVSSGMTQSLVTRKMEAMFLRNVGSYYSHTESYRRTQQP